MSREWGAVALVLSDLHGNERAVRRGGVWFFLDREGYGIDAYVTDTRPLVVIDPEDAEAVERLADAWRAVDSVDLDETAMSLVAYRLQAALREFADPKPRIEEPTGLGAVVEDSDGGFLVLDAGGKWVDKYGDGWSWSKLEPVRVCAEGWSE